MPPHQGMVSGIISYFSPRDEYSTRSPGHCIII